MREEELVNYGWRKRIELIDDKEEEILYWDTDEHFVIWYWLTYIGPKDKWRPPVNWNEIRKTLVSVGYEYKESYPYPKNSWRSSTKEEVKIAKEKRRSCQILRLQNKVKIPTVTFKEDKLILGEYIPYTISETWEIPEENL